MKILSIQSWVCDGHVGNAAAVFVLQRLGAEVAAIHTVQFSRHPGHGAYAGRVFPAADTQALIDGMAAQGTLATCDALLTGYIGDAGTGAAVLKAADGIRAARAHDGAPGLWCCDPVMGDDGRLYVQPEIPAFFAGALPHTDLLTPNQFELSRLAGTACDTLDQARSAALTLRGRMRPQGPRAVLVTSLHTPQTPPGRLHMLLASDFGTHVLATPLLDAKFSGAGDILAALFLFHVLANGNPVHAAERAVASLAGVLQRTLAAGAGEMMIVAAQQAFVNPGLVVLAEAF